MGLPDLGFANTAPEGPVGSQGSAPKLGPEACYIEKFEGAAAAGFINQCGCPSLGEVGLNIAHCGGSARPLVPVGGSNRY